MDPFTNITHYIPHIIQLEFSQKYLSYYYQSWPQNYTISTKGPNSFTLWEKPKKPNKTLLQSPLLHDISKNPLIHRTFKVRCYTTPLKSPLLHNTLIKSIATRQYFYKISKNPNTILTPIYKAQYYFGNYSWKPNIILVAIYKSSNTILATIHKSSNLFWQLFIKLKYYFGTYI